MPGALWEEHVEVLVSHIAGAGAGGTNVRRQPSSPSPRLPHPTLPELRSWNIKLTCRGVTCCQTTQKMTCHRMLHSLPAPTYVHTCAVMHTYTHTHYKCMQNMKTYMPTCIQKHKTHTNTHKHTQTHVAVLFGIPIGT